MPSAASVTDPIGAEVDWDMAELVADSLGYGTRHRVAQRDPHVVRQWCLENARALAGEFNATRSMTYFELAVVCGHRQPEAGGDARRDWRDLLHQTEQLLQAVSLKAKEETARLKQQEDAANAAAEALTR